MKILIVDDHPLVRKGIVSTVDFDEDIKEILEASKIEEAIKIIDKGSVPVKLEEISTISSSAIVDLNRQSKMGYGLSSLSEEDVVEEFQLSIAPVSYHIEDTIQSYTFTVEESLEEEDEIQSKINAIYEEIKQLENELSRLNVIEHHDFLYKLLFIQGI